MVKPTEVINQQDQLQGSSMKVAAIIQEVMQANIRRQVHPLAFMEQKKEVIFNASAPKRYELTGVVIPIGLAIELFKAAVAVVKEEGEQDAG